MNSVMIDKIKMYRKNEFVSLRNWVINMGFRLPSGSTLPLEHLNSLIATPNRRDLWKRIVNAVEDRRKIDYKKKGIVATKLEGGEKSVWREKGDCLWLWEEQQNLEKTVRNYRDVISNEENSISMKSLCLISEICELAELENQCEEYKEKLLILKLHKQRLEKKERELNIVMKSFHSGFSDTFDQILSSLKEHVEQTFNQHFKIFNQENDTGEKGDFWEEVINWKIMYQRQFENFLEELQSDKKGLLSKKKLQIENNLNSSLKELKQKMTEKALQVMVNTKEGKGLNLKIQEVMNKLEETYQRDESFNESFFTPTPKKDKHLEIFTNHAKALALKSYRDFLEDELTKLGGKEKQTLQDGKEKFEKSMQNMEAISNEIHALKLQNQQQTKNIMMRYEELQILLKTIKDNNEDTYREKIEETITSLTTLLGKDVDIFLETPFGAFRKVETPSGRVVLACESLDHCLDNCGGELNHFFTAMLLPPSRHVSRILTELEKRKKLVMEAKEFISKWEKLIERQKKSKDLMESVKTDSKIWEENLKEASANLLQTCNKSQQISSDYTLLSKILKNWVEQPYRFMVEKIDTVNGLTFTEFQKSYSKGNQ